MHALSLHAINDLRLTQLPVPPTPPGWVLVRIAFCGVCGSDIPRIFSKGTYTFPTVPGHEFAGTVASCGPTVTAFAPGDPVAVFPLLWCGKCPACEQGRFVQCADYDYFGSRRDGAFAEFIAVPQQNLLKVPAGVSLEEAAMTEPAAVALHALKRTGTNLLGQSVACFGAGPIGLMVAQWARAMGASEVFLFDVVERKLDLARTLGFTHAFNSRTADPVKTLESLTAGQGVHVAVDSAGVPPTLLAAMKSARRAGHVVLLGNPSADVTVPAPLLSQLMRREVTLLGTWNSDYSPAGNDDDWRAALAAMASKRLNLLPLITHNVALEKAVPVLQMMKENKEFYAKVLVHP